jgi:hypothetical protein
MRKLSENEIMAVRELVREMAVLTEDRGYDFVPTWVQKQGWVVVPVENTGHLAEEEIERIVPALASVGQHSCFAVGALELSDPLPGSYEIDVSADDLQHFNAECGAFRFLLTASDLSWAISCNEWFNLFAGPRAIIERMVGSPIEQARHDFLDYATLVEQAPEGRLVEIARQYTGE